MFCFAAIRNKEEILFINTPVAYQTADYWLEKITAGQSWFFHG